MFKKILIFIVLCVLFPGSGFCEKIHWQSYDDGIRLSRQENKKVLLYFRTDWCGYCAKMDHQTFSDAQVIEFLNTNFIAVRIDGDTQKRVVNSYKVKGFPDFRVLDNHQKQIFQLPGFYNVETFLFFLEYIRSDHYKTMTPMQYYKTL